MKSGPDSSPENASFWYGWIVLAVVFIVMTVMIGIRNSIGFFFKTIAGEFGWSRAETAGAYSIGMLMQSVCSPLFGRIGERWSLRWMMSLGVLFGGAAFLMGAGMNNLLHFYLMYALLNVGFAASTFVPQVLFYVGAALSGSGLGLTRPTASALLSDHFAGPGFGKLNGSVMTIFGLSGALGAFLTGHLFDISGNYRRAFLLLAMVNLAGAAAAIPLGRIQRARESAAAK